MPQIAMIQPATAKAPPPAPSADTAAEHFSPHLQNEINKRAAQTSSGSETLEKAPQQKATTDTSEESTQTLDGTGGEEHSSLPSDDIFITMNQTVVESQTVTSTTPGGGQYSSDISSLFQFLTDLTSANGGDTEQPLSSSQASAPNSSNDTTSAAGKNTSMNFTSVEASAMTLSVQSTEQQSESNALLLELQKIIANSNETGTATISISDAPQKGQASLENIKTPLTASETKPLSTAIASDVYSDFDADGSTVLVPGSEIPVEKSSQNLASMRHSIQQQYYEGKIAPENGQENQSSLENGQQENTFATKTAATIEGNISTAINQEQPNTFAQPLAAAQEAQKAQTAESMKPVTLPSGTVVQQEEVIRQIVERFQISRRETETRINIQLHPAELGELKIDLSVKEGSVRANVIAGSQYAQEIIEKNMVKLRSVLESQGFTVGEISVTCKADTTSDFNLFERQLFSHNEYTPAPGKNIHPSDELFTLDSSMNEKPVGQQGVNVKI